MISIGQDMCTPVGWAAMNGGTTGGGNVTPVTVTTLAQLQTEAGSTGAKVIYVSGTMGSGAATRVRVTSNKTIFGLPGATLNGGIDIKNAANVIIRNMIIKGPGAIDVDGVDCMTIDNSTNVWIDHCDISDGQDGNLDIINGSDYITVTWTKFSYSAASVNHKFSNLIGNSDSRTTDRGKLRVTMMFNYWTAGCAERMPRVRFGKVHVVNNLFDSPQANHCVRAGLEADILVESNVFKGVSRPIDLFENNFTAVTARNNLFTSTTGNTAGSRTSFIPPYSLSILNVSNVEARVKPCVGATLTVPTSCPCADPLPLDIIYFRLEDEKYGRFLEWKIADIRNVESIFVEHSMDGEQFFTVQKLGSMLQRWSINEDQDNGEFFRLKIVEADGEITYSKVISIRKTIGDVKIYPNPFDQQLNITGIKHSNIVILNSEGKILLAEEVIENAILHVSGLAHGKYFLIVTDLEKDHSESFLIIK
ncbi:MAG: T9SS type A sorting domain-containing protein [Cytophagaceae bacterium]